MSKRLFENVKCNVNVNIKIDIAIKFNILGWIKGGLATMRKFILWVWTGLTAGVSGVRSRLTK